MLSRRSFRSLTMAVGVLALILSACGDDSPKGDTQAYCKQAKALDEQDGFPTDKQLRDLQAVAPEAIRDDVKAVGDRLIADGEKAFEDKDLQKQFKPIEDFEAKECGADKGADDGEGDGAHKDDDDHEGDKKDGAPVSIPDGAKELGVSGVEYAFKNVSEDVAAGDYHITFKNDGKEEHEMSFVELKPGATADQVIALFKENKESEAEALVVNEDVGGTDGPIGPGESKDFVVKFEAGKTYAYACFIDSPAGPPHAALGMFGDFVTK